MLRKEITRRAGLIILLLALLPVLLAAQNRVLKIGPVVLTVADMNRSVDFYTQVLTFQKQSETLRTGLEIDELYGVPNARVRAVDLKLGDEGIELIQFVGTRGAPVPADSRSNDLSFQHVAIIVSDMDRAYAILRQNRVEQISPYPQKLPEWNPSAAGIKAFYFRDPDRHPLEILQFPPGEGDPKWQAANGRLFLGIDHTAIAIANTQASLEFYRSLLGLRVAGESDNYGFEQEHLNNVFGAHLHITSLRSPDGIGVEFLEVHHSPGRTAGASEREGNCHLAPRNRAAGGRYRAFEFGFGGRKKSSDFGETNSRLGTPIPCEPGRADSRP